jgi:predicted DCC family thiol-disulfide oxidoreductase YuxK
MYPADVDRDARPGPIVLYDGVCALCNGAVRFVLGRDRVGRFRFASLQSDLARATLARHGRNPGDLATIVVVVEPGQAEERLLERSEAVLFVLARLGGPWPLVGRIGRFVPRSVRDWTYDRVARRRYQVFGRYDACPLPAPQHRSKFLG